MDKFIAGWIALKIHDSAACLPLILPSEHRGISFVDAVSVYPRVRYLLVF
jgi:hypothetical protein